MAKERGYTDAQYKKLVAEVKKNPGNSERFYAEASGIPMGKIGKALYDAEVEADPKLKIPQTGPAIAKARDEQGIRWPRIAARTGLTVGKVQALYQEHTGKEPGKSWTGRGRRFDGEGAPAKIGGTGKRSAAKTGSSGRRSAAAGKRGGATAKRGSLKRGAGRRTTRAAANPK